MMTKVRYEEMRPAELAAARERVSLVYVPIGSTEYHGPHLPLGFDAIHAYAFCLRAAEQTGGVVLPPTFWGARGHEQFPGSLLLREETVAALMRDALWRLSQQKYHLIVIVTGHYPRVQGELLKRVAAEHMRANEKTRVLVLDPFSIHPTDPGVDHAGRIETSIMLYLRPDLVDMTELKHPDALNGIAKDCVDATPEYGRERLEPALKELIRVVKNTISEM